MRVMNMEKRVVQSVYYDDNDIKYDDITTVSSKEQKNLNKLRKQYGYQLNRVIEEYNLLNSHHTYLDFENHLKILNEKQSILFQDYLSSNSFLQNKISE